MRREEKRIDSHDVDMVAFQSDINVQNRNAVIAIDTAMQANYKKMKAALLPHLDPVIVVNNDDWGGTYTFIHQGVRETVRPISVVFELAKSVSHIPLGIYTIIAPYLKKPEVTAWIPELQAFRAVLAKAQENIDDTDLPHKAKSASLRILGNALRFIDMSIADGWFSMESYERFAARIHDDITVNMLVAGQAQYDGVSALLNRWKSQTGEQGWEKLYVVVLSMWTTMVDNQNTIIIREFMDKKRVDTHLIDISTAQTPDDPVAVALDNLARIVMDNIAAEMIFPTDSVLADSLKGTQDLLSNVIGNILVCPHARQANSR